MKIPAADALALHMCRKPENLDAYHPQSDLFTTEQKMSEPYTASIGGRSNARPAMHGET